MVSGSTQCPISRSLLQIFVSGQSSSVSQNQAHTSPYTAPMLRRSLLVLLLGCACSGGGDGDEPAQPDANLGLREFTITNMDSSGQTHRLTITCEDLQSETAITLTTDGDHQHSIRLEVTDLATILAGDPVMLTFTEGHEHSFTIVKPIDACLEL